MRGLFLVGLIASCAAMGLVEVAHTAKEQAWSWHAQEYAMLSQQTNPKVALAALYPSITMSLSQQTAHSYHTNQSNTHDQNLFNTQIQVPIVKIAAKAGYDAAQANAASQMDDYQIFKQKFILDLATRYFAVLKADKKMLLADKVVAMNTKLTHDIEQKYQVGLLALTDLSEAQAALDQAIATKIQASFNLSVAQDTLVELLQFQPNSLRDIDLNADLKFKALDKPAGENHQVQKYKHLLKAADYSVQAAKAGLYPSLVGYATYNSSPLNSNLTQKVHSIAVGIAANWTPFDGGATLAQYTANQYKKQASFAQLRETYLDIELNEKTTRKQLETARYQLRAQRQALRSAQVYLEATQASFEAGQRTTTDVLDAQSTLMSQEQSLYNLLYDTMIVYLQLSQLLSYSDESVLESLDGFLTQEWHWAS
ncbi:TolC family protein [bacterium]|nr:TolC family protein [bacterium]NBX72478.1 TolC family protein [bacterium]